MKIEMTFDGSRVEGTLEGKPFTIIRKGAMTKLEGIKDDGSFGGIVGSELLRFCGKILDGANVVIDETDDLRVWKKLSNDVAQQVEDAMV
jgi:hypothetical protein